VRGSDELPAGVRGSDELPIVNDDLSFGLA